MRQAAFAGLCILLVLSALLGCGGSAHDEAHDRGSATTAAARPVADRGPFAAKASRIAAAEISRRERDEQPGYLIVSVRAPRCAATSPTDYRCFANVATRRRQGQKGGLIGSVTLWTVLLKVDPATGQMRITRVSQGAEIGLAGS